MRGEAFERFEKVGIGSFVVLVIGIDRSGL